MEKNTKWSARDFYTYLAKNDLNPKTITELEIPEHVREFGQCATEEEFLMDWNCEMFLRGESDCEEAEHDKWKLYNRNNWLDIINKFPHFDKKKDKRAVVYSRMIHARCSKLKRIILPKGFLRIGNCAFYKASVHMVTFPASITKIDHQAFIKSRVEKVDLSGTSLTTLEFETFMKCTKLRDVILPDSLIQIGSKCFYGCRNLTSVSLPVSVEYIGSTCFSSCKPLTIKIRL